MCGHHYGAATHVHVPSFHRPHHLAKGYLSACRRGRGRFLRLDVKEPALRGKGRRSSQLARLHQDQWSIMSEVAYPGILKDICCRGWPVATDNCVVSGQEGGTDVGRIVTMPAIISVSKQHAGKVVESGLPGDRWGTSFDLSAWGHRSCRTKMKIIGHFIILQPLLLR